MAKIEENRAEFHGKYFKNNVSVIIEKGQTKEGNDYVYDDDKEGKVTVFLSDIRSYKDKKTGEIAGYIANIPIGILSDIHNELSTNDDFKEMFDKCVANSKIFEIVGMIYKGSSRQTLESFANDKNIPIEVIDRAFEVVEKQKSQEA
ncbi:hypothetical protein HNP86_001092 [Methanococcus maripaludis]|uniref:Uncharacterized protein n=2 Tax=Methanococcus maripaludis TaxID=39152 RepID=A0A7J9NUJ2_METMI|nr:hypothetical protein [Methanococcus maripaludis]AEK19507.1 hypothetical protein GYY_03140 [Methanococcus maripaludis X1]MBA2850961.1 hypothetical protein [Methanococcus maripaludis]